MAQPEIVVHEGAEDNGLGVMVGELMRENMADDPYKAKVFSSMKGAVTLEATDADVRTTLVFDRGRCVIHDGVPQMPNLWVSTDSDTILGLSLVRIVHGLPHLFDEAGLAVGKKLLHGEVRIHGMALNLVLLTKLTIVLSVN